jgi:hypothetical protein
MSMYGADAAFARAQREYENRMPPEADEVVMQVACDGESEERGECGWQGKTEVYIFADQGTFDCPECGFENSMNVMGWDEEDPDDARDRRLDALMDGDY